MSKKYSITTADYLDWNEMSNLVRKLANDKNYKMSLLLSIGSFWGLRISDMLKLKWEDILDKDEFTITEKKTGKTRTIRINPQLSLHIKECYQNIRPRKLDEFILISQKGTIYSIQRINVILKDIKVKYRVNVKNFSCHSLRKTFGRQVYNQNSENSEIALVKLMELFNHSNVSITKRYLGLRQEELMETYDCLSF
jgi:integrase